MSKEPAYWLQCQAPAGNWYDSLGTSSVKTCVSHMKFLQSRDPNLNCRVVTKTIHVLDISEELK